MDQGDLEAIRILENEFKTYHELDRDAMLKVLNNHSDKSFVSKRDHHLEDLLPLLLTRFITNIGPAHLHASSDSYEISALGMDYNWVKELAQQLSHDELKHQKLLLEIDDLKSAASRAKTSARTAVISAGISGIAALISLAAFLWSVLNPNS